MFDHLALVGLLGDHLVLGDEVLDRLAFGEVLSNGSVNA